MNKNEELDQLRAQMRNITADIIKQIQKRMELAEQIGEIKKSLNIEVKDERVEQDVRKLVLNLSSQMGMNEEFAARIINILLMESVKIQQKNIADNRPDQKVTHLGIFMKAKQMEALGKKIIHMEVGEPDYSPPQQVSNALSNSFDLRQYHYTETRGIEILRRSIADQITSHTGANIKHDQIVVTPGGRFAIFSAIASLLRPGDELISIEPAWPAYKECADFIGATTKILKTTFENSWTPDIKKLEEMIGPSTKMLVLNYPNNPTGKILDKKSMDKLVDIAKNHNLYILSDEVYSHYAFTNFTSILEYEYEKSIMVSSFSKTYAMTGFRVGYGISSNDIINKMIKIQAMAVTSVAEPMQYCALAALNHYDDNDNSNNNAQLIKKRLDLLSKRLDKMSLPFVKPDGAMYIFPRLSEGIKDISFVYDLLDSGVAIAPGSGFGESYYNFVRISACQPEDFLQSGLDIIEKIISKNNVVEQNK